MRDLSPLRLLLGAATIAWRRRGPSLPGLVAADDVAAASDGRLLREVCLLSRRRR